MSFKDKFLKYKSKYINLLGGMPEADADPEEITLILKPLAGNRSTVKVNRNATVLQVKLAFQLIEGLNPEAVTLQFNGVVLVDSEPITSYNIVNNSILSYKINLNRYIPPVTATVDASE